MKTSMEKNGDLTKLALEGSVTIEHVAELKGIISRILSESERVVVCFVRTARLDLSGIQLFCAANRSFESCGKKMIATGISGDVVGQALFEVGVDTHDACPENLCENCFWKGDVE